MKGYGIAWVAFVACWLVEARSAGAQAFCDALCSNQPVECGVECTDSFTYQVTTCGQAGYSCCYIQYAEVSREPIGSNVGGIPWFHTAWNTDVVTYVEVGCGYGWEYTTCEHYRHGYCLSSYQACCDAYGCWGADSC